MEACSGRRGQRKNVESVASNIPASGELCASERASERLVLHRHRREARMCAVPLLYALFINGLVHELNTLSLGLQIGGTLVCALLYADDIVLLERQIPSA